MIPSTVLPAGRHRRTGRAALGRLLRRGVLTLLIVVGGALGAAAVAWAYWSSPGAGPGRVTTGTLIAPTNAAASAPLNSSTVAVSWSAGKLASGQPATGYYVVRMRDSDGTSFAACGTSPTTKITTLSCNDTGVTDGDYHYLVTGTYGSWTATGTPSAGVHVVNNASLPSVTVTSISPTPNGNGWNNTSPVTVNLSASAGLGVRSITYSVDSGANVVVSASTAAVPVSGDGTHTVSYFATDTLGQVSQTQSVNVRIDRVAPAAPSAPTLTAASDTGSSTTDGITKVTTPTFTGTAESGATVTLYDGSTAIASGTATSGAYAINATLSAGTHTITARATDVAGNVSVSSTSTSVTVDTTAPATPAAPTLSAASDSGLSNSDRITNVTTPVFTGTAEAGSTVTLYNSTTVVGTAVATAGGTWSITSSALTNSTTAKPMTIKATDPAGNVSAASATTSVTIDTSPPSRPGTVVLAAASDSGRLATDKITNVTTPTFTGTTTAATTVTVYDATTTVIGTYYAGSTTWSLVSPFLADGTHSITAKATDLAGNISTTASTAISVVVDTVAPAAPSTPVFASGNDTGRSATDNITNKATPTFSGTNESKAIVTLREASTAMGSYTATGTTYAAVAITLTDGAHTLTATATDVAGNVSPASGAITFAVDTVAPDAPSVPTLTAASDTGVSATDAITKDATPTYTGTVESLAIATLYDGSTASGTPVTTAAGGAYTATTATLTNASHNITVKATDVAGNVSAASPATTLIVDTVAPTVTVDQASSQSDPTSDTTVHFTVVFNEDIVGFTSSDVTIGGTAGATTATIGGSGPQYDVGLSGMTKGGTVTAAVATAKVTDTAGNSNATSTSTDNSVTYAP